MELSNIKIKFQNNATPQPMNTEADSVQVKFAWRNKLKIQNLKKNLICPHLLANTPNKLKYFDFEPPVFCHNPSKF